MSKKKNIKARSEKERQYFGGWRDHRYGARDCAPITLAGSSSSRKIFRGEQRETVINRVMDVMRDWRQSPFEHEGATTAALRSSLCLGGHGFSLSEAEAMDIVATCLRRLGAVRPTWEQGQRHYAEPRENCRWCYTLLDSSTLAAGFCSEEHARFAREHWGFQTSRRSDAAFAAVERALWRFRQAPRKCSQCDKQFRPVSENSVQKFCSDECRDASRRIEIAEVACEYCSTIFRPSRSAAVGRYCSRKCVYESRSNQSVETTCMCCGQPFVAKGKKAMYCSDACHGVVSDFKRGRVRKAISPPVFDYVFRMAA